MIQANNLLHNLPATSSQESFQTLLQTPHLTVERIVSHAHATPEGEWYDQVQDEWVMVLQGSAGLKIEAQADELVLKTGDSVYLPAHCRHRVNWTDREQATVWLALHFSPAANQQIDDN